MRLTFEKARLERAEIASRYDVILGVVATFAIWVGEHMLYREETFPVVELSLALRSWIADKMALGQDFEYVSLESDEPGFVWIRRSGEGWRIGSIHQEYLEMTIWTPDDVLSALSIFNDQVEEWLSLELGLAIESYL